MKIITLIAAIFICFSAAGQKMKSGVAPFDRKDVNMIYVTFKGDCKPFIERIKTDLGPGQNYSDNQDGYPGIRWFDIVKPEWTSKKITVQLYWIVSAARQIVLISCLDQTGEDLLIPETELTASIKKYFRKKLN